ncbi:hypothetical protein FJ656_11265 [Schumannella luteola]|nr:hypothetical protein FJ656_11265 [Schumannella luteola]
MTARTVARFALAALLLFTGSGHLTWGRRGFRAAVPPYVPFDKDTVLVASGVSELALGTALAVAPRRARPWVGVATAAFFVAVLPGNIAHWVSRRDAPGLDSDDKRFARLFLQPVLVWWAWWSTRNR